MKISFLCKLSATLEKSSFLILVTDPGVDILCRFANTWVNNGVERPYGDSSTINPTTAMDFSLTTSGLVANAILRLREYIYIRFLTPLENEMNLHR